MRRLPMLVALVALFGCAESPPAFTLGPTDANVVGSFALAYSNGQPLPILARLTSVEEWDMTSDQLVIAADNTWNETSNYKVTSFLTGGVSAQQTGSSGTYSIANNQINFVITVGGTGGFNGSVSGNTLTLLYNGGRFLYTR
jgi:hypothetical protein